MPNDTEKQRNRVAVILTEASSVAFILLILFLLKQVSVILGGGNGVSQAYSWAYYRLIKTIPVLFGVYIAVDLFHPIAGAREKIGQFIRKWRIGFAVINTVIGVLAGLLLINTILALIIASPVNSRPARVTFLYDAGSMSRFMVQELAAPFLLESGIDRAELAILPLNEQSFAESVKEATCLIALSHGEAGKVYSTNPLKAYEYSLFEGLRKEALKLVYLSGCHVGEGGYAEKWKNAMAPAKTIVYDRESAVLEHIIWVVFRAKAELRATRGEGIKAETPINLTEDGLLRIGTGKHALSIQVDGNSIGASLVHNNREYIEVHINPSLEELIAYDRETGTYSKYYCTKYCLNENDDVLTELDPPHFGSQDKSDRKFYVNGDLVFEGRIEEFDNMESMESEFRVYHNGKVILSISKENDIWKAR